MKRSPGFTLVEITIALAIVTIGVFLAGMSLQSWVYKYNFSGMGREIFMMASQAKTMATSSQRQHRLVVDLTNGSVKVQSGNAAANSTSWSDIVPPVTASYGCTIAEVHRGTGGVDNVVTSGTANIVFNASGDAFPLDNASVRISGASGQRAQVFIYGWTSKARLRNDWN